MGIAVTKGGRTGWTLALLVPALALAGCKEEPRPAEAIRPVRAVQLADAASFAHRWFSGRAKATQEVDLSFRIAGPLIERPVDVGSRVQKGDLIARIDPATFIADVNKARAELERAIAEAANAEAQLRRQRTLAERGWTPEARLDEFIAAAGITKAAVGAHRAALERAELNLGYTELRAPFAGEIVRTYVENFQDVLDKQPIVRLLDSSRIEMVVDVPETLITFAHLVGEVEVVFDPFPDLVIPARIKTIGSEASETTRTYPVTLIMDQPEGAPILPGMAGRAAPKGPPPPQIGEVGLVVPDTAIFTPPDGTGTFVWILDPATGVVRRRAIRTGGPTRFGPTVRDGVAPGEWVVTAGVHQLKEGQKVRLLAEAEGADGTRR